MPFVDGKPTKDCPDCDGIGQKTLDCRCCGHTAVSDCMTCDGAGEIEDYDVETR